MFTASFSTQSKGEQDLRIPQTDSDFIRKGTLQTILCEHFGGPYSQNRPFYTFL